MEEEGVGYHEEFVCGSRVDARRKRVVFSGSVPCRRGCRRDWGIQTQMGMTASSTILECVGFEELSGPNYHRRCVPSCVAVVCFGVCV